MYKKLFIYSVVLVCFVLPGVVFATSDESDESIYASNAMFDEPNAPLYEPIEHPQAPFRAAPLIQFEDAGKGDLALVAQHRLLAMEFPGDRNLIWNYVINKPWEDGSRPEKLDDFIGIHPRLLLTQEKVNELKPKITSGTYKKIWDVIVKNANSYLTKSPANKPRSEDDTRADGDVIPWLALAYLMTDNPVYLNKAVSWMTTVCNYPEWQGDNGLGAGHLLLGVSLGYDWLYNSMTPDQRQTIRTRLCYFANRMAASSDYTRPIPQHRERYLVNHCQVEYTGLATAGFALYDDPDIPNAEDWIRKAYNIFWTAFDCYGDDGGDTEGHQYYALTLRFQLVFDTLAKEILGRDFYAESKQLQRAGYFILYSTLPDFPNYNNCVMRYGDTSYNYWVHGPTQHVFNLAREYRNPCLQWLALEMVNRGIGAGQAWASLLWYDDTVTSWAPASALLPTARHFKDTGWFTSRSDWSANAVMVGFKCGPFHGHKVKPYYDKQVDENWPETKDANQWGMKYHQLGGGHGHPDVGHFNVYAYGKWLAVDDAASKPKFTWQHNTILVNGDGQRGEYNPNDPSNWFMRDEVIEAKGTSMIVKAKSRTDYDYLIGDAMNIYKDPNLTGFRRHFVYLKPDIVIIADELNAAVNTNLQWKLNVTNRQITTSSISGAGDNFVVTNGNVRMDVQFVHLQPISSSIVEFIAPGTKFVTKVLNANFASSGSDLLVSVLHPRMNTDSPMVITSSSISGSVINLTIQCGERTVNVMLDVASEEVEVL